ncbi:MAG TPA: acetyltransferase [Bryobacteraceae bacterium]|nr:acetyltransferase [Bryobacteraceae bacterium]
MIEVRELHQHSELAEAVRLQQQIWGFEDVELLPLRLFVVATKIGGHVLGAFDGERMVGFSLAIPGVKPGGAAYWHSHMMGIIEGYRDQGIGRRLKLRQKEDALARDIKLIEWTFDPLELKNAHFNIERLGAVVRRYVLNQYGTTTSHLHGGLPTDRCVAEWHLDRDIPRNDIQARIALPADILDIRRTDPRRARAIQKAASDRFLEHFARGLAVLRFERSDTHGTYLLGPWPSE